MSAADKTYKVWITSIGVAEIHAPSAAAAGRRARAGDFDVYELQEPSAVITSLAFGTPKSGALAHVNKPVVYRKGPS